MTWIRHGGTLAARPVTLTEDLPEAHRFRYDADVPYHVSGYLTLDGAGAPGAWWHLVHSCIATAAGIPRTWRHRQAAQPDCRRRRRVLTTLTMPAFKFKEGLQLPLYNVNVKRRLLSLLLV